MKFHNHLYMCKRASKNKDKIIKKLQNGSGIPGLYLLVLPSGNHNQLEIFSSLMLLQHTMQKQQLYIVGFAYSYEEALILIRNLLEEALKETGVCDIRTYLGIEREKIK